MGAKNTVVSKEEAEVEEEEEVEERLHIVGVRVRFPARESRERKVTVEVVFLYVKKGKTVHLIVASIRQFHVLLMCFWVRSLAC